MLPGHEYTMANLDFCAKAEGKSNPKIAEYKSIFKARLDSGFPSIPSTLGEEKLYNVFMRTNEKSL
jgi:hydroxyacylglutathione hydrolase